MSNYRLYWRRHPIQRRVFAAGLLPVMPAVVLVCLLPPAIAAYFGALWGNYKDAWACALGR